MESRRSLIVESDLQAGSEGPSLALLTVPDLDHIVVGEHPLIKLGNGLADAREEREVTLEKELHIVPLLVTFIDFNYRHGGLSSSGLLSVTRDKLLVQMEAPTRKQSFNLAGRNAYVRAGDRFEAGMTFLAGAPEQMADLSPHLARRYDPINGLRSVRPVDRYAAAKALRFRPDRQKAAMPLLTKALKSEREPRVALELAGTAAALGLAAGESRIGDFLWSDDASDLSMEAILILTEAETSRTRNSPALRPIPLLMGTNDARPPSGGWAKPASKPIAIFCPI